MGKKNGGLPPGGRKKKPKDILNQLVPAGPRIDHDLPPPPPNDEPRTDYTMGGKYIDPVEFCMALINADPLVLGRLGIFNPPSVTQRIEAARIAIPYTNARKPVEVLSKHEHSWVEEVNKAEDRLSKMREEYEPDQPDSLH